MERNEFTKYYGECFVTMISFACRHFEEAMVKLASNFEFRKSYKKLILNLIVIERIT